MDRKVGQHQPVFEIQDEIRKQWQNQMGSQRLGHAWAVAALLLPISQKKKKIWKGKSVSDIFNKANVRPYASNCQRKKERRKTGEKCKH